MFPNHGFFITSCNDMDIASIKGPFRYWHNPCSSPFMAQRKFSSKLIFKPIGDLEYDGKSDQ